MGINKENELNITKLLKKIGFSLVGLFSFSVIMQIVMQRDLYHFTLISALWIFSSYILICFFTKLTIFKTNSEFKFCISVFITTFIWGMLLIFLSVFTLTHFSGMPFIGVDDVIYHEQQVEIANRLMQSYSFDITLLDAGFYSGYPNFGGIIMYLLNNTSIFIPRVATLLLFSLSVLIFYSILKKCYPINISRFTTLIYALSPMFVLYSIVQMKDGLILFFILMFIFSLINISLGKRVLINLILLILTLVCLIPIRAMIIITLLLSIIPFAIYRKNVTSKLMVFTILLLTIAGVVLLWNYASSFELFMSPKEYYEVRFENLGDSNKLVGANSAISKLGYTSLVSGPLFVLLSPLLPIPTVLSFVNPNYPNLNIEFASNLFMYSIIPFFFTSLFIFIYTKTKSSILVLLFSMFFIYKIGSALSGMTVWSYRQSLPATLLLLMIIPLSLCNPNIKKWQKLPSYFVYILLFVWSFFRLYIRL